MLTPAYVGGNGCRFYEREQLLALQQIWTPDRDSYPGLGRLYVDDPGFRARYDAKDPGLAEYLRDATAAYAEQRL